MDYDIQKVYQLFLYTYYTLYTKNIFIFLLTYIEKSFTRRLSLSNQHHKSLLHLDHFFLPTKLSR